MKETLQKILIYFLHYLLAVLALMKRPVIFLGQIIWRVFSATLLPLLRIIFRPILIFAYRFYFWSKRSLVESGEQKILNFAAHRFVSHFIVILLVFLGTTSSIFALEHSGDYALENGSRSAFFYLLRTEEDYLEEVLVEAGTAQRYLSEDMPALPAAPSEQKTEATEISPLLLTEQGALLQPVVPGTGQVLRQGISTYTVESGDTLAGIAKKFGVSIETVLWENKLTLRSIIRPGNQLKILPFSGLTHKVQKNETIVNLAKKYKVTTEQILAANNLVRPENIRPGDILLVPGGSLPPPPPRLASLSRAFVAPAKIEGIIGLIWPTLRGRISQYFTWRHAGIDIAVAKGTPIYAVEDAVVEIAGWSRVGYGWHVVLRHPNGLKTRYAHATRLLVSAGDIVQKGQSIALVGSTGRSSGAHLHFEVISGGRSVNPLGYIR